jgi:hypothetical protein
VAAMKEGKKNIFFSMAALLQAVEEGGEVGATDMPTPSPSVMWSGRNRTTC